MHMHASATRHLKLQAWGLLSKSWSPSLVAKDPSITISTVVLLASKFAQDDV